MRIISILSSFHDNTGVTQCRLGQGWGKGEGDLGTDLPHDLWKSLNYTVPQFHGLSNRMSNYFQKSSWQLNYYINKSCDEEHVITVQSYVIAAVL